MSKLIVEMEMPKSCPCDLIGIGYDIYCSATSGIPKRVAEYDECVKNGTKPDWCPIVGVLPDEHGRLVDIDSVELAMVKKGQMSSRYKCGEMWELNGLEIREALQTVPTIVPATERSET